jgi:hypothetical protein
LGVGGADGVPRLEFSSLGLLAADAEPVPAPTVGSGIPELAALLLPAIDKVPEFATLTAGIEPARDFEVETATDLFCWAVARRAAAACSGVTLAGRQLPPLRSDSLELRIRGDCPSIEVFTTVATAPAARTPDTESTVTTRSLHRFLLALAFRSLFERSVHARNPSQHATVTPNEPKRYGWMSKNRQILVAHV